MPRKVTKPKTTKSIESLTHREAKRKNIPTAEHQSVMRDEDKSPIQVAYERRNKDLDPQLVWRGKDMQDWSDLVVQAGPLYVQEKVHPKVLIDDLLQCTRKTAPPDETPEQADFTDLFADFNGIPEGADRTDFYQHDANWSNRMILGDSLQVMASLAEREGLRGQVQCIYLDPPYGIKFNSNFQWSTTSRDVKDGKADHITREPEQVKAFRDTWRDGIHSYLTYLRDRLTVARDLLADSGSIFVQIGEENVHRVRGVLDEVFGEDNFCSTIQITKTGSQSGALLSNIADSIVWYAKSKSDIKYRKFYVDRPERAEGEASPDPVLSSGFRTNTSVPFVFHGKTYDPGSNYNWKTHLVGMKRLAHANRLIPLKTTLRFARYYEDYPVKEASNIWSDLGGAADLVYVVQTATKVVQRCILMATDPGDLVLDPTCGSGTTAYVAEQWGRRWITIDTSRVALALARARIMGARYPYYLLADSPEGQEKEAALTQTVPSTSPTYNNIRHGFVYERVPHITLKSIANNTEIDVIWDKWQETLEPLRQKINEALGTDWQEWEIPRELTSESQSAQIIDKVDSPSVANVSQWLKEWWQCRIARQQEIDASIAAKADSEYLYDKPYTDNKRVRVAGPFTVESESPHRMLAVDEDDNLVDVVTEEDASYGGVQDFTSMILENLRAAGVQQAHKEDRIIFTSLTPWPGNLVCAEGRFAASGEWLVNNGSQEMKRAKSNSQLSTGNNPLSTSEVRAGILIGPEFGTVQRNDLVEAARECGDAGFDVLIACAFNYDAHASEFDKLGRIPVLKARMNADLHMAKDLKATGQGNLFVIFGEPDLEVVSEEWIVDSHGTKVAPYEVFKLVSGTGSLAEVNGLGSGDLQTYLWLSNHRKVWDYLADAAGSKLDSGKHRGGSGPAYHGGVSTIAWHSAGLPGGIGDFCNTVRKAGIPESAAFRKFVDQLRGNQQNAPRTDEVTLQVQLDAIHKPLSTIDFTQVTVNGVDVFKPQTGEVVSDGPDGIACWFIDTDYNEESFFVRHAYFLGQNDPYKSLKQTLKAEINEEAWATLHSATSRPFEKPKGGRIAVKVINHLGDEVMKVYRV